MSDLKELSQRQVCLEKVDPLKSNRLVTFVNHFLLSVVQQLNELTATVDSRLYDLNNQILRCNANLVILEMKLNSIPGLSSVATTAPELNPNITQNNISLPETTAKSLEDISAEEKVQTEDNSKETTIENTSETNGQQNDVTEEVDEEEEEEAPEPEDPRIAKYKKMVQLGIPLDAVHQKMKMDGIDTQLLKH